MKVFLKKTATIMLVFLLSACGQSTQTSGRVTYAKAFIEGLGWECGALSEVAEVTIPLQSEPVFTEYNKIQKENGYDLTAYCGRQVTRYSYEILNHPRAEGRQVLANILIDKDTILGGDIMVTALDGFMHGLCRYPGE